MTNAHQSAGEPADRHGEQGNATSGGIGEMCFRDAWAALQTSVEHLQRDDLDIEDMSATYGRAMALADRCAGILAQVQHQVAEIDPELSPMAHEEATDGSDC